MKSTPITSMPPEYGTKVLVRLINLSEPGPNGCSQWTGAKDRQGYGKMKVVSDGAKRTTGAHRAAWLAHHGSISDGMVLDHLCRNPSCVNVEHLEPVTSRVNTLRGDRAIKRGAPAIHKGCKRHGFSDGYTHMQRNGYEKWVCRHCQSERMQRYMSKKNS